MAYEELAHLDLNFIITVSRESQVSVGVNTSPPRPSLKGKVVLDCVLVPPRHQAARPLAPHDSLSDLATVIESGLCVSQPEGIFEASKAQNAIPTNPQPQPADTKRQNEGEPSKEPILATSASLVTGNFLLARGSEGVLSAPQESTQIKDATSELGKKRSWGLVSPSEEAESFRAGKKQKRTTSMNLPVPGRTSIALSGSTEEYTLRPQATGRFSGSVSNSRPAMPLNDRQTDLVDFELLDIPESSSLPFQLASTSLGKDVTTDGTLDSSLYLPPGMKSIIDSMKTTLLAERSARLAIETRYEHEVELRFATEKRLVEEIEKRLKAEQSAKTLDTHVTPLTSTGTTMEKNTSDRRKFYRRGDAIQANVMNQQLPSSGPS
ncbi:hypothetical protein BDY19DRAFT_33257 [Irpex rosettiformis]|uniref:Uncharacterized protein n=1 Tax=Irpex rosettiformis TaxID=378272 RepID=A0ACB8UJW1_9APHY|nr:hypothetical protein BDY19DRAFT_33257 [Irpex rosettiformis]